MNGPLRAKLWTPGGDALIQTSPTFYEAQGQLSHAAEFLSSSFQLDQQISPTEAEPAPILGPGSSPSPSHLLAASVSLCLCVHIWEHVCVSGGMGSVCPQSVRLCTQTFALETKGGRQPEGGRHQTGVQVQWTWPRTPQPLLWPLLHISPPHPLCFSIGSGPVHNTATSTPLIFGPLHVLCPSEDACSSFCDGSEAQKSPQCGGLTHMLPPPTPTVPLPSAGILIVIAHLMIVWPQTTSFWGRGVV